MGQYKSQHTGPQIDAGVDAALNPDVTVTPDSDALVTSGAVADALDNIDPTITSDTDTALNGVLFGNGSKVGAKSLDTSSLTNDNNHVPTSGVVKSAIDNVADGLTFKRIHVNMVGKTVGTTYTVDLPSGYTFANTIFISASNRVWNSVYDAFGNDANVECRLAINGSNKISIIPIGQYSVNGELIIVIAKE